MGSQSQSQPPLPRPWLTTPLIPSPPLSLLTGANIFLKLENLQPSGSFKSRGIGNMMLRSASSLPPSSTTPIRFYCSSEGNAGIACATTAATLSRQATIVLPTGASPVVIAKLKALGAEVVQHGVNWPEADGYLRGVLLKEGGEAEGEKEHKVYVSPFNHEDIWSGAATLVDEVRVQMEGVARVAPGEVDVDGEGKGTGTGPVIDAIVCNVGGGGLLNGIMEGLERLDTPLVGHDGRPTKVLAMETVGADSLNASVKKGEHVTLPGITSIAMSLGATRVSDKTWEWAEKYALGGGGGENKLISATVTDGEAAMACVRFADDGRMLVEVACGATMATAYNGDLRRYLGGEGISDEEWAKRNIVMVVCGGNNTNLQTLEKYRETYAGAL